MILTALRLRDDPSVTHRDSGKLYKTMRRDEYNVDENGSEAAGGKDDSKYDAARRSMSIVNC